MAETRVDRVAAALKAFIGWLDSFGEMSYDHQSYYAGPIGRRAKALYYRNPWLGVLAVSPMVLSEALWPRGRMLFWKKMRLPIADAHYAMGFALLFQTTGDPFNYRRALDFLNVLIKTRSPRLSRYAWGYPFDWTTQKGTIRKDTPLITTTPYVYEAFDSVYSIDHDERWLPILKSIADHAFLDFGDFPRGPEEASSAYFPNDPVGGVLNASAYRAVLLTLASVRFHDQAYWKKAQQYIRFVLRSQAKDGSWPYAAEDTRNFVDHFHTCFILKALAKIDLCTPHEGCRQAIEKGVDYYLTALFDDEGLPKPFAKPPRLTVYRHDLYDYAECINLGLLLFGRFSDLDRTTGRVIDDLLDRWRKKDGSFRSRQLHFGWDNVPMHRWGQSQIFRSLCLFLHRRCATVLGP